MATHPQPHAARAHWRAALAEGGFVALALGLVAAAHDGTAELGAARIAAVLGVTVGVAMHVRLAQGRLPAALHATTAAALLVALGAAAPLIVAVVVTGLIGAELVARCSSRACVLRAGVWTAVLGAGTRLAAGLMSDPLPAGALASEAAAAAAGGVLGASAVLAIGPIAEWVFGHATRLTLNERLDYDHPLLRKLMASAPGTFQHSVNVGVLADAAARAVRADALVARVGGLYHDVGKMNAPAFFAENQDGANPHDTLDPAESAAILRAHVSDGVDLVNAHGIGERIADFVREHHGTSVMRPFQAKAASLGRGDDAGAYRYPGPRPRSRETAIVMIADQLEATARAGQPADDAARLEMVRQTLERIRGERQLDESGLSSGDLAAIQAALDRALEAMHHRRISYPKPVPERPHRSPFGSVRRALRRRRAS